MTRTSLRVAAVLTGGAAVLAVLYWAFLNTPDSNATMLVVSSLLVVMITTAAAITVNAAILVARGGAIREAIVSAPRGAGWFVLAFSLLVLAWVAIARVDRWISANQGEINAWFIVQFGWADISPLLQTELWISRWLRWAVLPVVALSLLTALLTAENARSVIWLRRACHWRTLLLVTAVFVLLFVLPWQLTAWRPELPPTWIEPAVAAIRLATVFVLGLIGTTVLVVTASRSNV